jgi:carbon-monoxide dehydrogenase iron sulfur subunit
VKRIVADPAKCLACRGCELACALAHAATGDLVQAIYRERAKPRIYVEAAGQFAVPLECRHCDDAPCVRVCPSGALQRSNPDSPVLVAQERCIGCAFCVEACPFGVIQVTGSAVPGVWEGRVAVIKCDLCQQRQAEGLPPACVSSCPVGALSFGEVDDSARRARAWTAAQATLSRRL